MTRAVELYDTAIKNVRSFAEMQQAYITREMFSAQDIVCRWIVAVNLTTLLKC